MASAFEPAAASAHRRARAESPGLALSFPDLVRKGDIEAATQTLGDQHPDAVRDSAGRTPLDHAKTSADPALRGAFGLP